MGDTSPNHSSNSRYRNPTFYYMGTLDPLGRSNEVRGQESGTLGLGFEELVSTQTPGRIQKVDPLMGVPIKYP